VGDEEKPHDGTNRSYGPRSIKESKIFEIARDARGKQSGEELVKAGEKNGSFGGRALKGERPLPQTQKISVLF